MPARGVSWITVITIRIIGLFIYRRFILTAGFTPGGAAFIPTISPQPGQMGIFSATPIDQTFPGDRLKFPGMNADIKTKRKIYGVRYSFVKVESNTYITPGPIGVYHPSKAE